MEQILVVDDEKSIVKLCKRILEKEGYRVVGTEDPERAISFLDKGDFDLVISDIRMPKMDGLTFLSNVENKLPDIPLIFISGYVNMEMVLKAMREGASGFILKPFTKKELLSVVEKVLNFDRVRRENVRLKSLVILLNYFRELSSKVHVEELVSYLKEKIMELVDADKIEVISFAKNDPLSFSLEGSCDGNGCYSEIAKQFVEEVKNNGNRLMNINVDKLQSDRREYLRERGVNNLLVYYLEKSGKIHGAVIAARTGEDGGFSEAETNTFGLMARQFEAICLGRSYYLELEDSYQELIESLAATLEARDEYTGVHALTVAGLATKIGRKINFGEDKLKNLELAGRLHDIGKIAVPDSVLLKPGKLSDKEFDLIKRHPVVGCEILAKSKKLVEVAKIVRHHHEWFSGEGYPDGLKEQEIPLLSRILCLADAFHALTSDRPYRKAFSVEKALKIIREETPKKYDPQLVEILEEIVSTESLEPPYKMAN